MKSLGSLVAPKRLFHVLDSLIASVVSSSHSCLDLGPIFASGAAASTAFV